VTPPLSDTTAVVDGPAGAPPLDVEDSAAVVEVVGVSSRAPAPALAWASSTRKDAKLLILPSAIVGGLNGGRRALCFEANPPRILPRT